MSEICCESKRAATRGIRFFPNVEAGARMWLYLAASPATTGAIGSARWLSSAGPSAFSTSATPSTAAAASAAGPQSLPATST